MGTRLPGSLTVSRSSRRAQRNPTAAANLQIGWTCSANWYMFSSPAQHSSRGQGRIVMPSQIQPKPYANPQNYCKPPGHRSRHYYCNIAVTQIAETQKIIVKSLQNYCKNIARLLLQGHCKVTAKLLQSHCKIRNSCKIIAKPLQNYRKVPAKLMQKHCKVPAN